MFEEEQQDDTQDFATIGNSLISEATDLNSALDYLKEAYSVGQYADPVKVKDIYSDTASRLMEKFEVRNKYDRTEDRSLNETLTFSLAEKPVIDETNPELSVKSINEWEKKNLEAIKTSDDPSYIENRKFLLSNTEEAARQMRQSIYGKDNWWITDYGIAFAQGIASPVKLFGYEGLDNWAEERSDPTNRGFMTAIFSGAGSAVGTLGTAVVGGLAATAAGASAPIAGGVALAGGIIYQGAGAIGEVVDRYNDSLEVGADPTTAAKAAGIEAASQFGQVALGSTVVLKPLAKVGGAVAGKILGKEVAQSAASSSFAKGAVIEGLTEGAGQVVSNTAEFVGTRREDLSDIAFSEYMRGVPESIVAGGAVGGVVGALDSYRSSPEAKALKETVQDIEGTPPPDKDVIVEKPITTVEATPTGTIAKINDDVELVIVGDRPQVKIGEQLLEPFDAVGSVDGETLKKIHQLNLLNSGEHGPRTPDGQKVVFGVNADGQFGAFSRYVNDDLTLSETPRETTFVPIELSPDMGPGRHVMQADKVAVEMLGETPVYTGKWNYLVDPIQSSTVGALKLGTLPDYRVQATAKRLTERYGPQLSEALNLITVTGDGETISLEQVRKTSRDEYTADGVANLQKEGADNFIARLENSDRFNRLDVTGITLLRTAAEDSYYKKLDAKAPSEEVAKAAEFLSELVKLNTKVTRNFGEGLEASKLGPEEEARTQIGLIRGLLEKRAEQDASDELGVPVSREDLSTALTETSNRLAELEKVVGPEADLVDLGPVDTGKLEDTKALDVAVKEAKVAEATAAQEIKRAKVEQKKSKTKDPESLAALEKQYEAAKKKTEAATARLEKTKADNEAKVKAQSDRALENNLRKQKRNAAKAFIEEMKALREKKAMLEAQAVKLDEKTRARLQEFPAEVRENLKTLHEEKARSTSVTEQNKINNKILEMTHKFLPATPVKRNILFSYFRMNWLSGMSTQVRNIAGNSSKQFFDISSRNFNDVLRILTLKAPTGSGLIAAKGFLKGARERGVPIALDVLMGRQYGRFQFALDEEPKEVRKLSGSLNPIAQLLNVTELARRGMAATDSFFAYGAEQQGIYLATWLNSQESAAPLKKWKDIENSIYGTEQAQNKVKADIDRRIKALESAGVEFSENDRRSMFFERMQSNQSEQVQAMARRQANDAIFSGEPEGLYGNVLYRLTKAFAEATTYSRPGPDGKPIFEESFGNFLLPFARTTSNVADWLMQYVPVYGHFEAYRQKRKGDIADLQRKSLLEQAAKEKDPKVKAKLEKEAGGIMNDRILQVQQTMANANFGFMAATTLVAAAAASDNSDEPWFEMFTFTPQGKYQQWKEQGLSELSIRIGGQGGIVINLRDTPLVLPLVIADGIRKSTKKGADLSTLALNTLGMTLSAFSKLSMAKTWGELTELFQGSQDSNEKINWARLGNSLKNSFSSMASGAIPASGFLRNLARMMEENPKNHYNDTQAKLMANLPFGGWTSDRPLLGMFGDEIKVPLWNRSPGAVLGMKSSDDPLFYWMQKSGYSLTPQAVSVMVNKTDMKALQELGITRYGYQDVLSPEQYDEMLRISGPVIKQLYTKASQLPQFAKFSDENQKELTERVNKIRAAAKLKVLARKDPGSSTP